ncbi:HTH-type transcriptional regulator YjiE [bioreactor metagenome]|uniref:HTH-type transcriptional regulator YjiE n=1 Tax=bioreactor metagenome TaxID=1076179 RepID=A0A645C6T5_9ZZZZ
MVDLTSLKDFLVLCQVKSFSRASERCHVSISGLSRRIQGLEQWLGAPVFDRHKSALELTDAGHRLQAVASEVVYALEGVRKSVRDNAEDQQLRIRFAAPHVMSAIFFPDWIPKLHNDFRSAKFSVDSDNLPECVGMLHDGAADYVVALLDDANAVGARMGWSADAKGLERLTLGEERLIPVSAPNAAGQPLFDLSRPEPSISFLGYAEECHLGWALQPHLHHWQFLNLQQRHSASLTDGLRFMALSQLGLAWLPETLVRNDLLGKRLIRAGDASFDIPLRYTLMRSPHPLGTQAEALWASLSRMAQPMDGAPLVSAEALVHA